MKILIGTPIHQVKDYAMERWLAGVNTLRQHTPADFLMVDNSPDEKYMESVRGYCEKIGIKDYNLEHIDVHQENGADERIGRSREVIRQEILHGDYDAWFTWECDQIIPPDSLKKLVKLMENGNYQMVLPNTWAREVSGEPNANFGCALVRRECLEKYGFLLEYPDMPNSWHGGEVWFKKQVLKGGGNYIEVYGMIDPVHHLNK
jgi:hypothetical protein